MVDQSPALLIVLSAATALVATVGGLGGAIFLVPALALVGVDPRLAAPLGALSVAAGSLAAAPRQLDDGLVHHRLGITLETAATAAAIVGALLGESVPDRAISYALAGAALVAAVAAARRRGMRNLPHPAFSSEPAGEWPGTLSGAYRLDEDRVVPYQARRVGVGLIGMAFAGLLSGLSGVGGGFIKTPVMNEVMTVPIRVAAATSTFTVGITAAASLIVFAGQGRIDARAGAAVVVGALVGGLAGARLGRRLPPMLTRRVLTVVLVVVAVVMVVQA